MPLIFLLRNPPHSTPPQVPTKEFALAAPKPAEDLHDEARKSRLARDHESTTMMTALEGRPPPLLPPPPPPDRPSQSPEPAKQHSAAFSVPK